MLGPYLANRNNVDILKSIIEDSKTLCKFLNKEYIFVLDRGFRHIKDLFKENKYKVLVLALEEKRKQLSTKDSNKLRYVTKIRWTFKSTHGMLKQKYRILNLRLDNKLIQKVGSYFRIPSFLNNTFRERFHLVEGISDEIIQKM